MAITSTGRNWCLLASFRKTDFGLPFVETRTEAEVPFPVKACDRILKKEGFRPMTPDERAKFGKFLRD